MRAIIGVSDKTGVTEFARGLSQLGYEIFSTGGTKRSLVEAGVTFVRGTDFFTDGGGASAARLAFSYEPPERIAEGVRLLASLL